MPPLSPAPEIGTVVGPDGLEYVTAIVRPHDFDRTKRYPVIVSVYGGPHGMVVALDQRSYLLQQWLANQGAIVVLIDNRGTPRRDRAWERAIKGSFGRVPLNDQIAALQALGARYQALSLSRVGIYVWSFGGSMAAL